MSRVSLIEQLYAPKKKSALEFDYDKLWAPPIRFFLSQQDINELYKIATSLKYNDNIEKKYELIDAVMRPRGFKRGNCGTNRVVYNFLEDTSFCMKIALDRVGIKDSPREFKNQEFFKPFCCKIFEVDPTGVIACVERVNPISSLEEFISVADDIFNMMVTKIIGKYVVDDLGTEKFMNYGTRYNANGTAFGPVVLDYPYAYELDGAKLHCAKPVLIGDKEFACNGEIDYDAGLNNLVCSKCGRTYSARELARDDSNVLKFYSDEDRGRLRARIVREDGTIIKDSGRSSKTYITKEEYEEGIRMFELKDLGPRPVEKTIKNKYVPMKKLREQYHSELQLKAYEEMQKRNAEPFNPAMKSEFSPRPAKRAGKNESKDNTIIADPIVATEERIQNVTIAARAEDAINEQESEIVKETTFEEALAEALEAEPDTVDEDMPLEEAINKALEEAEDDETEEVDEDDDSEDEEGTEYYEENDTVENSDEESEEEEDEETVSEDEEFESNNSDEQKGFDEEMEAEVFPEMNNDNIIVGVDLSNDEEDYSNYIPPEEEDEEDFEDDEDDEYSELYAFDRKAQKRDNKKQQNKSKKFNSGDMSDY